MPVTPETGAPVATTPEASNTPAQLSAEDLRNSLVDMVDQQKSAAATPEVTAPPTGVVAPETNAPELGAFGAKGAAVGSRVDMLVDRGASAVTAGRERVGEKVDGAALKAYELAGKVDSGIKNVKERAANVRERVRNGAEAGAEKTSEAVKAGKEKSQRVLLGAIGLSITAAEGVAEVPEKIKNRGRKIADRLNKWCAKAKESFSGMKDNVRDRVASGFGSVDAVAGRAANSAVEKLDSIGKSLEARAQARRREIEAAKEEAERKKIIEILVEDRNKAAEERINTEYDTRVGEAQDKHDKVVAGAGETRSEELAAARKQRDLEMSSVEKVTAKEFAGMTIEQLNGELKALDTAPSIIEPVAESTPEAAPKVETVTAALPNPGSAPVIPETAAA